MCVGQVKPEPFDVVETLIDVNARLARSSGQVQCREGCPWRVLRGRVASILQEREAKNATWPPEDMNLHRTSPAEGANGFL